MADPRVVDPGARIDLEYVMQFLGPYSRAVFVLRGDYGFNDVEIANLFGVSGARISQKYKAVEGCLSKAFKGNKAWDEKARKRKMEEMGRFKREKIPLRKIICLAEEAPREMEGFDETRFQEWLI